MNYSPKLKKAMEEIKEILSKHDIAGIVVLHTPGNSEFLLRIDPTYSCCRWENGEQLRVKAKLQEDFNGDKKAWHKKVNDTSNMLALLAETTGKVLLPVMNLSERVDKTVNAEHYDGGFSSDKTQQN